MMSKRTICALVRASIILVGIMGAFICYFYYLLALFGMEGNASTEIFVFIIRLGVTIPCFVILGIGWVIAGSVKREVFTVRNARLLRLCAVILFVDAIVYLISSIAFYFMGENLLLIIPFVIITFALIVSLAFFVLSYYDFRAAELREENEGII